MRAANGWNPGSKRSRKDPLPVAGREWVRDHVEGIELASHRFERGCDILGRANLEAMCLLR